jgi:hypothetical protein
LLGSFKKIRITEAKSNYLVGEIIYWAKNHKV